MIWTIVVYAILAVVVWTFWQVVSLLVWRKKYAPTELGSCFPLWRSYPVSRPKWFPFTGPKSGPSHPLDAISIRHNALRADFNVLTSRHNACVAEFTAKLQAICPHADVTTVETEDYQHRTWPAVFFGACLYGRKTVRTCDVCDRVLEDKFEEYIDQTPPVDGKCS